MRFSVLGPLHVRIAGGEVRLDGPRQAKMLATLLVDANTMVATERLVAVMWDGRAPATAVRQVQDALSGLRRNLAACGAPGSLISTRRGGYQINLAPDQLDLLQFDHERHLAQRHSTPAETAAALRRALACWRGNALADISSRVLEFDAAQLNEKRAATHKLCLSIELDLGRHREVVEELTVLVREHPYDEHVAEHLMVALYRCRRQVEALQVYERLRRTLVDELSVDPTPPIQALHRRILAGDPSLAAPVPPTGPSGTRPEGPEPAATGPDMAMPVRQLPLDVPDFVGRVDTLATVARLLDRSAPHRAPVVVVVGGPGVGKSTLVTHAARLASAAFPDGQLYLDLAGTSDEPRDPALMLAEALRALSIAGSAVPEGLSARAALYRSLLADRRTLVVLDDAGHADQVLPLLPGAKGCAVLITSRTLLTHLPGARHIDLDVLEGSEARELFTGIVGRQRVVQEPAEADAILDCCGNLPLAIRIAGAKLTGRPAWSLRVLRERIEDESRRLAELRIGNLSVRASVELSLRLLPADAVCALSLLGLLGPCTLPGWVVGPLLDRPDAEDVLDALVDASLVRLTATDAIGPGIAVTASSGDNGYGASYPASSHYVTAVGGTSLTTASTSRGWSETAWSGAGSGCSTYNTALSGAASFSSGCAKRAEADVSAVANPSTGVAVYDSTAYQGYVGWMVFGGTSVSSPIIASVYALAGNTGSIDNNYPYTHATSLWDVTSGSNGSCPTSQWCNARAGWDGPTGLGTPDGIGAF